MLFSTLIAAQTDAAAGTARLTCYNVDWPTSGPTTATATSCPITEDVDTCVRYQFTCTEGDRSCSGVPVGADSAGTTKWAYTFVSAATCETMKNNNLTYPNTLCCSTDLCNKPDPALDPDTRVVDSPVLIIGAQPSPSPSPAIPAAPASPAASSPLPAAPIAKGSAGRSSSSLLLLAAAAVTAAVNGAIGI